MVDTLIIRLNSNGKTDWALQQENQPLTIHRNQELSQIPQTETEQQLIVIVPSEAITLVNIQLPNTTRAKLLQAVPYAVENLLTENIEQLHFAIGTRNSDNTVPVACVTHKQMQKWLTTLNSAGFYPNIIVPDNLLLPINDGNLSIHLEADIALVRTGTTSGFTVDAQNLSTVLHSLLNENVTTEITVNSSEEIDLKQFASLPNKINTQTKEYLHWVLANFQAPPLNLLQQQYKITRNFFKTDKKWRLAIILAVIWLFILFFGHTTELIYLKYEQHHLQNKVLSIYTSVFPSAANMEDPRSDLKTELRKYQGISDNNQFLITVGATGHIINALKNIKLQELNWQNKQGQIKISCASFAQLDQFTEKLTAAKLQIQRDKVTTQNKIVVATLTIKPRI